MHVVLPVARYTFSQMKKHVVLYHDLNFQLGLHSSSLTKDVSLVVIHPSREDTVALVLLMLVRVLEVR